MRLPPSTLTRHFLLLQLCPLQPALTDHPCRHWHAACHMTQLGRFYAFNPRIALIFLCTRVALGGKKPPTSLSRRTTKLFDSNCTLASSKKVIARTTGNCNMAAQTGSTYFSGTMIDSVEIPTEILGFRP